MIAVRFHRRTVVHVIGTMILPLSAGAAWGQMRHFPSFVGLDPFHSNVRGPSGSTPCKTGDAVLLGHKFGLVRFDRIGRILRWRDGRGYCFSDLSRRGNRLGFPHVFIYDLRPRGADACRLSITVRGHWTAAWLPASIVRFWFRWVFAHLMHVVRNRLLVIALRR
jgi:hypothetical protein